MNPDTTQPNAGGAEQPIPQVLALTKAIGQAETGGNYNAVGDGGNSQGAYQMSPAFIQKWAPVAGVQYQPGQPLDPETQNKIAYNAVKTMGTTGDPGYSYLGKLSPAQIASAWNAGDPNAYLDPSYGQNNAYGSVANYVSKVQQNYEKTALQSNPLGVDTANAASGAVKSPSFSPSIWEWLLGAGAATGGFIAGAGSSYLKNAVSDLATDALIGGAAGTVAEPGGGTILGALGGAGTGLIQAGIQTALGGGGGGNQNPPPTPASSEPSPQDPNILAELASLEQQAPQIAKASSQLSQTTAQALGTTIGGRQMLQDPQMQAGLEAIGKYGLAPQVDSSGNMNWQPAMQKASDHVAQLSQGVQEALTAEGGVAPTQEAVQHAKQIIRERLPAPEWEQADKEIDLAAGSYDKAYGDGKGNMSLGHFQQMKQETSHGKKWGMMDTTTKKEAFKALARGARKTIEGHTQHKELYNRVMKEEQKLINARSIAKRLNGKKGPKNEGLVKQLLHSGGKYAALYIGDKIGGPLGAVLGSMVGDYAVKAVDRKYGKTIFETPAIHKALEHLEHHHPSAYKLLVYQLDKAGITYPQKRKKSKSGALRIPTPDKLQFRGQQAKKSQAKQKKQSKPPLKSPPSSK